MRDTKEYWQDIHDQELSQRMLNKCAQKNPVAPTTGNEKQSKLSYSPSLSRKGGARHA